MKTIDSKQSAAFKAFVDSHEFFLIAGHKDPDGDCVSSSLAAAAILKALGKEFLLLNVGPFKRPEIRQYENLFSSQIPFMGAEDAKKCGLLLVDCSELSRTGDLSDGLKGFDAFIVDHHKTAETPAGAQSIIDPTSPAAVCLFTMLYESLVGKPDPETARIMFLGLSTDTGFFRFLREDSAEVFELAARLVRYGANPNKMYNRISGGKPYSTRKLLGVLLGKAERHCNGKLAITYETMEDTKNYGQEGRDSDALYSALLSVEGIEAVVFLRQETDTTCTGGFRSLDDVDVSTVAAKFGGGGHKNASGMSVNGKIATLIPQIVKEFSRVL